MFFKKRSNEEKAARTRKKIEQLNEEISKIWNPDVTDDIHSDVNGWYTGNPEDFDVPEQDHDDL